jgi:hypothetical protein
VRARAVAAHDRATRQNNIALDLRFVTVSRSVSPEAAIANESRLRVSLRVYNRASLWNLSYIKEPIYAVEERYFTLSNLIMRMQVAPPKTPVSFSTA